MLSWWFVNVVFEFFVLCKERPGERGDAYTHCGYCGIGVAAGNSARGNCFKDNCCVGEQNRRADRPDKFNFVNRGRKSGRSRRSLSSYARGQLTIEFLILFVSLLAIYAMVFPAIAQSYSKATGAFDNEVEKAALQKLSSAVEECKFLQNGSTFSQTIFVSRNLTFNGLDLQKGSNLVVFRCNSGEVDTWLGQLNQS